MSTNPFIQIRDAKISDDIQYNFSINDNFELVVSSPNTTEIEYTAMVLAVPTIASSFTLYLGNPYVFYNTLDGSDNFILDNVSKIASSVYGGSTTDSMERNFPNFIRSINIPVKSNASFNHKIKINQYQDNKKYRCCIHIKMADGYEDLVDCGEVICPPFKPKPQTSTSIGLQISNVSFIKDNNDDRLLKISFIDNNNVINNSNDVNYPNDKRRSIFYGYLPPGSHGDYLTDGPFASNTINYNTNTFDLEIPMDVPFDIKFSYIGAYGVNSPSLTFSSASLIAAAQASLASLTTKTIGANDLVVGEDQLIPESEFDKYRCVLDIAEISAFSEKYYTSGEYVSKFYTIDDAIYMFSLRVDEFLPEVNGVTDIQLKYASCRYFVQFGNNDWIPISPINRIDETDDNNDILPKNIILDTISNSSNSKIKYISYPNSVYSFRIKIVMKIDVTGDNYYTPIINSYQCTVFDKNKIVKV